MKKGIGIAKNSKNKKYDYLKTLFTGVLIKIISDLIQKIIN